MEQINSIAKIFFAVMLIVMKRVLLTPNAPLSANENSPRPCVSFLSLLEMVEAMKQVASIEPDLNTEERNLLSVAYKNVIGARRASWRIISSMENKGESKLTNLQMVCEYKKRVRLSARPTVCVNGRRRRRLQILKRSSQFCK